MKENATRNDNLFAVNDLVRRARAGEGTAWDELYLRFQASSLAFCRSVLGDPDRAEDVLQESFFEAARVLHRLKHDEAFAVWFRRILIKQCDRVRRVSSGMTRELPADLNESSPPARAPETDPYLTLEQGEIQANIERALNELPALERKLCIEFYFERRDQNEISRRTGLPLHTIKNRMYRARRLLRRHLESGGAESFRPLAMAA